MKRSLLTRLAPVVLLPLALTACSSAGADDGGVATLTGAASDLGGEVAAVDSDQAMLDFASCMRDNGFEDFPDPVVGDDGSLEFGAFGGGAGAGGGNQGDRDDRVAQREAQQAARESCGQLLEGLDVGGRGRGGDGAEFDAEAFLEYASCMRENGVNDFPDPGADGRPDRELLQALDFESPSFQAATEACSEVGGGFGAGGPGGRGAGGPGAGGGQ